LSTSVEEARALGLALVAQLGDESLAAEHALDRVLRGPIYASADVPARPTSTMDGYAVRSDDLSSSAPLRVVAESAAGRPSARPLAFGEAAGISTGALLPPGADAVVPLEEAARVGDEIISRMAVEAGEFVRAVGSELRRGELVVARGRTLDPPALALIAGQGIGSVRVARRPEVAILSTGAELRPIGAELAAGEIHDANGPALAALVRQCGGVVRAVSVVGDSREALQAALASCTADLILLSGGVSVGAHDHVRAAVEAQGGEVVLWRVAMKPGKPLLLARLGATPVVGLPGNPVSAQVGFLLFVRPMLRRMLGAEPTFDLPAVAVLLDAPLALKTDRPTYLRAHAYADGVTLKASVAAHQGSSQAMSMRDANALVRVEPGEHRFASGTTLPALLIGALGSGRVSSSL
jgi:molybdopterin molybdotransferase